MSRYHFASKSLQEISIIILIFCLNFHASKCPEFPLIYYQFVIKKVYDEINEIYQHLVYKSHKA